jgi:DNA-nicking Smr family endonuclease
MPQPEQKGIGRRAIITEAKSLAEPEKMKSKTPNGPFKNLDTLLKSAGMNLGRKPERPPCELKIPDPPPAPEELTEEELFVRQMKGVRQQHSNVSRRHNPEPPKLKDSEAEERKLMESALAGDPALEISVHPEYIEGWVGLSGKQYIQDLRSGMYSIQGQIDLHGLSRDEARVAVEEFVERMSRIRPCCVKIVHGRGINSPSDRAILKENLQRWLLTRRLGRHVVAYASAPLRDGGVGAIYLLLRSRL